MGTPSKAGRLEQPFAFTGREIDFLLFKEVKTRLYYSTETREGSATPHQTGGGRIEMSTPVTEDLYFYRARHYDPHAGRFITKDPIGFAGGCQRECNNHPLWETKNDPPLPNKGG